MIIYIECKQKMKTMASGEVHICTCGRVVDRAHKFKLIGVVVRHAMIRESAGISPHAIDSCIIYYTMTLGLSCESVEWKGHGKVHKVVCM